jgi:alcohol dehydrogenase/propanol-preferring alcohol dehydrogenase
LNEVVTLARGKKIAPIPVETRPLAEVNQTLDELKVGKIVGRIVAEV